MEIKFKNLIEDAIKLVGIIEKVDKLKKKRNRSREKDEKLFN